MTEDEMLEILRETMLNLQGVEEELAAVKHRLEEHINQLSGGCVINPRFVARSWP